MQHFSRWLVGALVVLGLGGIGILWWQKQQAASPAPITAMPPLAQAPVVAAPEPVASAPADYPVEAIAPLAQASAPLPPLAGEIFVQLRASAL